MSKSSQPTPYRTITGSPDVEGCSAFVGNTLVAKECYAHSLAP